MWFLLPMPGKLFPVFSETPDNKIKIYNNFYYVFHYGKKYDIIGKTGEGNVTAEPDRRKKVLFDRRNLYDEKNNFVISLSGSFNDGVQ